MSTAYFAELTGHTIEEAETLLRWAGVKGYNTSIVDQPNDRWHSSEATNLIMYLHNQPIEAIRAGSDKIK